MRNQLMDSLDTPSMKALKSSEGRNTGKEIKDFTECTGVRHELIDRLIDFIQLSSLQR